MKHVIFRIILFIIFSACFFPTGCQSAEGAQGDGVRKTGLFDHMAGFDPETWEKSNWANGAKFNCAWLPDHVTFDGKSTMILTLDNTASLGKSYSSGAIRTIQTFGYGRFEVRMKAAKGNGIISSFFLHNDAPQDEIDIEILGKDTTKVQFNYFVDGFGSHETYQDLGFDASSDYHTYAIEWRNGTISWYVDDPGYLKPKRTVNTGRLPSHAMQITMNLWAGRGLDFWCGAFTYTAPLHAYYDYVRYIP